MSAASWFLLVTLFIALAGPRPARAQSMMELFQRAMAAAERGEHERAAPLFERLYSTGGGDPSLLYMAARHYVRAGDHGAAMRNLEEVIALGWQDVLMLTDDSTFAPLYADEQWSGLVRRAAARHAGFDQALREELLLLAKQDQEERRNRQAIEDQYGLNSPRVDSVNAALWRSDSLRQTRLDSIAAERGWPGRSMVAYDGAEAAWLILQHAELQLQEALFPVLVEAAEAGEVGAVNMAYLVDRIRTRRGEKQLYGTQLKRNPTSGCLEPYPIEDPERVDQRRAEVGLSSLAEYFETVPDEQRCQQIAPGSHPP